MLQPEVSCGEKVAGEIRAHSQKRHKRQNQVLN